MSLCEVRVPACKRPELLKRAVGSLLKQTHGDWIAIIMDDSPEQEGKDIADYYRDNRIIYSPNKIKLGRCGNLDRAFQSASYMGADSAFVLEDDNYLFPDFISANIELLKRNNVSIVLRNQQIRIEKNGRSLSTGKTTRGHWFYDKIYEPIEMYSYLFFHTGISNGGLFWDTEKITSNLQVGLEANYPSFQEMFRCLQITDRIYFASEPLCVFTLFESRDIVKMSKREIRLFNRAKQSIYMYLLRRYGSLLVKQATEIADRTGGKPQLEHQLIDALYTSYDFQHIKGLEVMRILTKAILRYFLYKNPIEIHYKKRYYRYDY